MPSRYNWKFFSILFILGIVLYGIWFFPFNFNNTELNEAEINYNKTTILKKIVNLNNTSEIIKNFSDKMDYQIIKIIDGDTFQVDYNGKNETVRLIGIDTPELSGSKNKKCFGAEAKKLATDELSNKRVNLESDNTQDDKDKYGRLLRYVVMSDRSNFNLTLIEKGLAREYTFKTPYKYQLDFKNAEIKAKNQKLGLWSACSN